MTREELYRAMKLSEQSETKKTNNKLQIFKLSDKVVKLLVERIKDEYHAHFMYRAAANWCHDMNYKKASIFFDKDAKTELKHAEKLQKYLSDFNIVVSVPQAESEFNFKSLPEIIYEAYDFELQLMKSYNENSLQILQEDITTFDFLQEFREIQKNSVIEFNDLINGLDLVDKNDKFQLLYFEQTFFEE